MDVLVRAERPTFRQLRVLAWLRDPTGNNPDLPQHPAIRWDEAAWTTGEIMARSGVYTRGQRAACLADLRELRRLGKLMADVKWRIAPSAGGR